MTPSSDPIGWHRGDPGELFAGVDIVTIADLIPPAPEWTADALCREFDTELWFPTRGQRSDPALDICGRCLVRTECLDEALDDETLDYGIRGGQTAAARRVTRREREAGRRA